MPMMDNYDNPSPPPAYPHANANANTGGMEFVKYQPGQHINGLDVSGGRHHFGGALAAAPQQGGWAKPDKYTPAMQYKEHSGLTHASSGGSGTLNNPVHKVPKVSLMADLLPAMTVGGCQCCVHQLGLVM